MGLFASIKSWFQQADNSCGEREGVPDIEDPVFGTLRVVSETEWEGEWDVNPKGRACSLTINGHIGY